MIKEDKIYSQSDAAWKEALRKYLKDFVQLCWNEIYDKIDWNRGYDFLEQELQVIMKNEGIGKRITDKLIKVWLKDGEEFWALLHLEVQGSRQTNFPERIFVYRYRIFDIYQKNVATFVVLADNNPSWRPNTYKQDFGGPSCAWSTLF